MIMRKIMAYGIMILLIITMFAYAAEAADLFANIDKTMAKAITGADCDKVGREKRAYYEKYLKKDPATIRKLVEEDVEKCKAEAYVGLIEDKVGGIIGGGLRAVLGAVKGVLEGFIKDTPLEKSKDVVINKLKYKTDLEYKINEVKIKNEQLWTRACDELEKIGEKCERPKKVIIVKTPVKKKVTTKKKLRAPSTGIDPDLQRLLDQMK